MKLHYFIFLFIFYSLNLYACHYVSITNNIAEIEADSLNTVSKLSEKKRMIIFKFGNPFYLESHINNKLVNLGYMNYPPILPNQYIESTEANISDLSQSNLQLLKAMKMNYNLMMKDDLGTFGKILGGAVGVSAFGLGIYHLIKYKDEYFK